MTNQTAPAEVVLRMDMFEPLIGEDFTIGMGDEQFALALREVTPLKYYRPEIHKRPPFTLLFACPDQRVLPQSIYALEHSALGLVEIFLVPVAANEQGVSYEAVFN